MTALFDTLLLLWTALIPDGSRRLPLVTADQTILDHYPLVVRELRIGN